MGLTGQCGEPSNGLLKFNRLPSKGSFLPTVNWSSYIISPVLGSKIYDFCCSVAPPKNEECCLVVKAREVLS